MRDLMVRAMLSSLASSLLLAACSDSLALKDDLEAKVEYAAATYTVTLTSDSAAGTLNIAEASVHNEEALRISATPNTGYIFSGWSVADGSATIADPASESTTVTVVGAGATIQAEFIAPIQRNWVSLASSSSGQYLAAAAYPDTKIPSTYSYGLYTSSDYGATWKMRTSGPAGMTWSSIASDDSGRYLAAAAESNGTIYTSSDFGATWVARSSGLPMSESDPSVPSADWTCIASDASGQRLVAAARGGAIYTSADFGSTWTARAGAGVGLPDSEYWCSVSSSGNGQVLTASCNYSTTRAFYSTNGGGAWTAMDGVPSNGSGIYVAQNAQGSRFAVAVSALASASSAFMNQLGIGRDWSWNSVAPGTFLSWRSVAVSDSGQYFVGVVNGGSIVTSDNYCNNGSDIARNGSAAGLPSNGNWACVCSNGSGSRLAAGVNGGRIYRTSDFGASWRLAL